MKLLMKFANSHFGFLDILIKFPFVLFLQLL